MYSPGNPASSGSYDYEVMQPQQQASEEYSFKDLPKGKGHWDYERRLLPPYPKLTENPTEQQHAEQQWRRNYYGITYTWVPDPKPEEKSKEQSLVATDRERPPMHPLPRRTSKPPRINIHRHEAQCSVCRHPDRQIIEDEFVNWASPRATAKDFGIDFRALYRHARVYHLIAVRNRNIRGVLSQILERAEHIATPTADAIIRGVKFFTRVNDEGQWIEPSSHVIFSTAGPNSGDSSSHPDHPDEVLDISPAHLGIRQNRRSDEDRSHERAALGKGAENMCVPVRNAVKRVEGSIFAAKAAKVRRAANLATSQLAENTHRRLRYPETHFAVHRSRKIRTKAKKSRAALSRKK